MEGEGGYIVGASLFGVMFRASRFVEGGGKLRIRFILVAVEMFTKGF